MPSDCPQNEVPTLNLPFTVLHSTLSFSGLVHPHTLPKWVAPQLLNLLPIFPPSYHCITSFFLLRYLSFHSNNPISLLRTFILCSGKSGHLLRLGLNSTYTERGTSSKNTNFTNLASLHCLFFSAMHDFIIFWICSGLSLSLLKEALRINHSVPGEV